MKVKNMISSSGNAVANQFIIETKEKGFINGEEYEDDAVYFQSYDSIIAKKVFEAKHFNRWQVYLDKTYWDYSNTIGEYRNLFLGENKKKTEKKIKSGEYILTDLNR